MFSRKMNQTTQKKSFFYCLFFEKTNMVGWKKVVKIYYLTKLSGKTKSYIAHLCFHEKRIKSFKILSMCFSWKQYGCKKNSRKFIFNQDFMQILPWPPYVFTKKSCLFIFCMFSSWKQYDWIQKFVKNCFFSADFLTKL